MRVILLVALVASVAVSVPAALAADAFDHTYSTFAPVLSKHVAKNRVNYSALALDQETLAAFVESIGDVKEKEYRTFTRDQQRAFWINVYNALVLQIVIDSYPIKPDADRKYSKYPDNSPMSIEGRGTRRPSTRRSAT
ncbi:MAG: DUF547 domain-containing protein [Deltaproteobacteria bacterium]|nr:DUF547 domain-containing protein [Deltaproteobacteria bacterium]